MNLQKLITAVTRLVSLTVLPWMALNMSTMVMNASPNETFTSTLAGNFRGVTPVPAADASLVAMPGPLPGMTGIRAKDGPAVIELQVSEAISTRGSMAFWLFADKAYHGGIHAEPADAFRERIIDGKLVMIADASAQLFECFMQVFSPEGLGASRRTQLPGLPGPAWYHFAFEWDSERGIANSYLNGSPASINNAVISPWPMEPLQSLTLTLDRFAVSDLRLSGHMLDQESLRAELTQAYRGSADILLGTGLQPPEVIREYKGDLIYANPLRSETDIEDWVAEGPLNLSFDGGWLRMASEYPSGGPGGLSGHIVLWCPVETPADFVAEWDFQIVKPDLAIVFFSTRGRDGKDLFDPSLNPRNGDFVGYTRGDIDTYHISYYSHHRLTSNLRKNHGFYMPATGPNPEAFSSSKVRRARLMKNGGHIQMTLDDEVIIDFHDDGERYGPVLGGGRIGLRQMRGMVGQYRDFRIYKVRPDRRPSGPEVPQYGQMPSQ